jgi:hypothetical protein
MSSLRDLLESEDDLPGAADGTVGVLLTQVPMTGPTPTPLMRRFWRYAFATRGALICG